MNASLKAKTFSAGNPESLELLPYLVSSAAAAAAAVRYEIRPLPSFSLAPSDFPTMYRSGKGGGGGGGGGDDNGTERPGRHWTKKGGRA